MNKLWYTWEEMRRDVNVLARDIVLDKFDPVVIVGLSRGGLTPGVMLSHWFKKPFKSVASALRDFPEWEDYLPRPTDKRVLLFGGIMSVILSQHIMSKKLRKILQILGYISLGNNGGTPQFNLEIFTLTYNVNN
mgnify:CR=1 FL=1